MYTNLKVLDQGKGVVTDRNWGGMEGVERTTSASKNGFEVMEQANRMAQMQGMKFAETDMMMTCQNEFIPNDTFFGDLWGINNTGQSGGEELS